MSEPLIELNEVHYRVPVESGMLDIISGANLSVQPKEKIAIVGRSGSGKSTLLALLAGLELPTSGDIALFGESIANSTENARAELRAKQVGFIFQNFQLMPSMSALENVLMPLELFEMPNAKQKALEALERVGLASRAKHKPSELSGGEQQRVAIARAIVTEPKVIFADEPTGSLDEETAHAIQSLLFNINDQLNTTLVLVTHDLELAQSCDRQIHIQHGQLVEQLAPVAV